MFFFWYKPEEKPKIIRELKRINRFDLVNRLYPPTENKQPFFKKKPRR